MQVAEDLIWVWAASGPAEFINSAAKSPLVTSEMDDLPDGTRIYSVGKTYMREVPYDWQARAPHRLPASPSSADRIPVVVIVSLQVPGLVQLPSPRQSAVPSEIPVPTAARACAQVLRSF